jgi:hypothetical protein
MTKKSPKYDHDEFLNLLKQVPAHLHPRQTLFLSADIVGSTLLKQTASTKVDGEPVVPLVHSAGDIAQVDLPDGEKWFSVIQGFYIESVQAFRSEWKKGVDRTEKHRSHYYGSDPILWKTIGDEILFRKVISDHHQINNTLKCWIRAMDKIRKFLKSKDSKLDIKCTAWLAEFPLQNKMVIGPSDGKVDEMDSSDMKTVGALIGKYENNPKQFSDTRVDFVGPAIDIGFRLSSKSTNRKFIISLDVAYYIAKTNRTEDDKIFKIHYDGREYLKGVLGGVEYPIFWIDMSSDSSPDKNEDKLFGKDKISWGNIEMFCKSFYKEDSNPSYAPFIVTDTNVDYHTPPRNYLPPYWKVAAVYAQ